MGGVVDFCLGIIIFEILVGQNTSSIGQESRDQELSIKYQIFGPYLDMGMGRSPFGPKV